MLCAWSIGVVLAVATPAAAQDVFGLIASGPREQVGSDVVQCGALTLRFDFYDQNSRMALTYTDDILDYEGNFRARGDYTVLDVTDRALLLALDGESRMTVENAPVRWWLRVEESGATCWQRADFAPETCNRVTLPCPGDLPLS